MRGSAEPVAGSCHDGSVLGSARFPRQVASGTARLLSLALVVALLAGVAWMAALRPSPGYPAGAVTIATGGPKGVYSAYGAQLARLASRDLDGLQVDSRPTSGSVENLRRVGAGSVLLGFTAADAAADARRGRPPFDAPLAVSAIGRIYDDFVHLVVRDGVRARTVKDLRGLRVSLGSYGSGTELIADRVLGAAGLTRDDVRARRLSLDDSAAAMRRGQLDAFFWSGGLPTMGVTELATHVPVRLIDLGSTADTLRERHGSVYRRARVPAGTYAGVRPVESIAVPNYLVTSEDADPGLVEALTRLLFDSREELATMVPLASGLDPRAAIYTAPLPLHAGAERYYRSVKN
jgi:TRAP transporter TAXI family solute receptor